MINFPASPAINDLYPVPAVPGIPQYKWDGTTWLSTALGLTGPAGPAGPAGPTGPAGPAGADASTTRSINAVTAAPTYTFVLTDAGKLVTLTHPSSGAIVATVPPNSAVAFAIGTQIDLAMMSANIATISQGSGVSIISEDSKRVLPKLGSCGTLTKTGTDTWLLCGSLIA